MIFKHPAPVLLLTSFCAIHTAACGSPGERAGHDGDGDNCPAGEVCSDKTPEGLIFYSDLFSGVRRMALGGRMELWMQDAHSLDELRFAYRATTEGLVEVARQDGNQVSLRAVAEGTDLLRIVDRDDGKLFDRIELSAAPIASVELTSKSPRGFFPSRPPALWANAGEVPFDVALLARDRGALYDRDLAVRSNGAVINPEILGATFGVSAASAGTLVLQIHAGAGVHPVSIPVVTSLDLLERPIVSARVGAATTICFNAVSASRNVERPPWTYASSGVAGEGDSFGCFRTTPSVVGPASVTASAGGLTTTATFTVQAATTSAAATGATATAATPDELRAPATVAPSAPSAPSAGERAAAAAD